MLFAGIKTLGISILVMLVTSFVAILVIRQVLLLSIFSLLFTYLINGYVSALMHEKYPYFLAYMTSVILIVINLLFTQNLIGMDVFLNPDIIFYSLLIGTLTSLLGAYAKTLLERRREANA
jgi:hypothetical protein